MTKNSRKHSKKIKPPPFLPFTPPGFQGTGNLLRDLEKKYGQKALNDPNIRAAIRREYRGLIEIKRTENGWHLLNRQPIPGA